MVTRLPYYAPGQCPHQDTSFEVSLPSLLPPFSLNPSAARFLTPLFSSRRPCLGPSLPRSFPSANLPPSTLHCRSLPVYHHRFLPPSLNLSFPRSPSLPPSPCPLPPINHPSSLLLCLPPCRRPIQCAPYVCLAALYCVAPSDAWH